MPGWEDTGGSERREDGADRRRGEHSGRVIARPASGVNSHGGTRGYKLLKFLGGKPYGGFKVTPAHVPETPETLISV